jgi:ribonucleoside-diphosphate reductase alpha chain
MDSATSPAQGESDIAESDHFLDQSLAQRYFTREGEDPFDQVEWKSFDCWPEDSPYHMKGVEAPDFWSQQAVDITAKLYLAKGDKPEKSIRQLIDRVCAKITYEGVKSGYFGEDIPPVHRAAVFAEDEWHQLTASALDFYTELCYICLHQLATFNSPVWFNIGRNDRTQCPSACFLTSVEDNTESIMKWARDEAFIFKAGAGNGLNISALRASNEPLSTGGTSSGPISFIRIANAVAEAIKSGGQTRRAAKMLQMDADHPDILDFVECKIREEDRLRLLAKIGVNIGLDIEGERNIAELTSYQSANHSVRVTDEFMKLATTETKQVPSWKLIPRKNGPIKHILASDLLNKMSEAVWNCADPGIMFHDIINLWHTTPNDGPIRTSNPCAETHLVDNSSCNLGSINVLKFINENGTFQVDDFRQTVDVMTLAMEILVEFCELPTELLTKRTKQYRWLGLGVSNMGAAIMVQGFPYDSDPGRDFAASVMALLTGRCYRKSSLIAEQMGSFDGFISNRQPMLNVICKHMDAIPEPAVGIWEGALVDWCDAHRFGCEYGFRNAQASVIAPAGTTSYYMDCDTTGIEPAFSLVTYKTLAGGGSMKLVNNSVKRTAELLGGYSDENLIAMADGDFSSISPEDESIFYGANEISAEGHIKMLAAVQPFISGAASKTINMPNDATSEEIRDAFIMAWKLGVKCIAIYRDGSKARQVLSTKSKVEESVERKGLIGVSGPHPECKHLDEVDLISPMPTRRRLPRTRKSITHKIHVRSSMGEHEGYITAGCHTDGTLGEVFLEGFGRMGGFTQNVLAAWATAFSVGLQYGVPLEVLVRKHVGHCDETGGIVLPDPEGNSLAIRTCDSIVDYIARWIVSEFGSVDLQEELGVMTEAVKERKVLVDVHLSQPVYIETFTNGNGHAKNIEFSANSCPECLKPLHRAGSCWTCSCGFNTGCG